MRLITLLEHETDWLYHGTDILSLGEILQANELRKGRHRGNPNEPRGISLTTSKNVAVIFQHPGDELYVGGTILFERSTLERSYNLIPYADETGEAWMQGSEYEEVVETEAIKPLDAMMYGFTCDTHRIETLARYAGEVANDNEMTPTELLALLRIIRDHPKRIKRPLD